MKTKRKCPHCGKDGSVKGTKYCDDCLQARRDLFLKRKVDGLCPQCGLKPPEYKKVRCAECLQQNSLRSNRTRRVNREQGVCTDCGSRHPAPDHKTCGRCLDLRKAKTAARKNSGGCVHCGEPSVPGITRCARCRARDRASYIRTKDEVFAYYGGYRCVCCGETMQEFLTIDHIDGNGAKHRKLINQRGFYRWLKHNGFPTGYRVLCWNCNVSRGIHGYCPHERID